MHSSWVLQGKNKPALSWFDSHTVGQYQALDNWGAWKESSLYMPVDILTHSSWVRRHIWSHCQMGSVENMS